MTEEEFDENSMDVSKEITLKEIIMILILKPTTELATLLNQTKYKYAYLIPVFLGIIAGLNNSLNKTGIKNLSHFITDAVLSIPSSIIFSFLFCFVYSWIIVFLSYLLKGISSSKMIFGLISYSLIPMILGGIINIVVKLYIYSNDSIPGIVASNIKFFNYGLYGFVLWSMFILVIGNAIINNFSYLKSFISTAGIFILLIIIILIGK